MSTPSVTVWVSEGLALDKDRQVDVASLMKITYQGMHLPLPKDILRPNKPYDMVLKL